MPIRYDDPREVGADRIANAVAARRALRRAVIVVDFGTSTNFDIVSAEGEYVGGVLAPGIEISMDALFARAARLFKVDFVEPPSVIGKTTAAGLQSGLVYGFAGQVDAIVERIRAELGADAPAIATGGLADLISRTRARSSESTSSSRSRVCGWSGSGTGDRSRRSDVMDAPGDRLARRELVLAPSR